MHLEMRKILSLPALLFCALMLFTLSCKHPTPVVEQNGPIGGFPADVGKILVNKCAVSGCHNDASYQNSSGLRLDTWAHLFEGGSSGASVIPYSPDFSPLLYFVNTDPSRGTVATPTMPYDVTGKNANVLSADEYTILKNWIAAGAPDADGNVAFSSDADTRQKFYLTQQGCDLAAVIDAKTNLIMRYIHIGTDANNIESPHCLRMSSDSKYAYVSFLSGSSIQKINTKTDAVVSAMALGAGSWNICFVAPGDTNVITTDWRTNGRVIFGNTNTMTTIPGLTGSGSGAFVFPHGIATDATYDTCFITAQYGNVVYRYAPKIPDYRKVSIDGNPPVATNDGDASSPNPHEILMAPDYSKYFLTCQSTNKIQVLDAHTDAILASIDVGTFPQEMAISHTRPYLFVTCMEDANNPNANKRGSVYVINYNTYAVEHILYGDFYQPHGIAVDDINGKILVASTNANPDGPAPHHATACGGRAGWYTMYDLTTLNPVDNKRYEVTVMPYSADVRFKP